jgi:hypothetical protein
MVQSIDGLEQPLGTAWGVCAHAAIAWVTEEEKMEIDWQKSGGRTDGYLFTYPNYRPDVPSAINIIIMV